MKPTYYTLFTAQGETKLAQAIANKTTLKLTHMAIGDGNGQLPTPKREQTSLIHECRRAPLNALFIDPINTYQLIAEHIIPEEEGGWWIRELGLFDEAGELCAIANCAPTYKPKPSEGTSRTQIIRFVFTVGSTQAIELKTDPSIVLATRQYVDHAQQEAKTALERAQQDAKEALEQARQDTKEALDRAQQAAKEALGQAVQTIQERFAPLNSPAFIGTPRAPTPGNRDNSERLATTAFVQAVQAIASQRYLTQTEGDGRYWRRSDKLFPDLGGGVQRLPSGLILQWGFAGIGAWGSEIWFPVRFPNTSLTIQVSHQQDSTPGHMLCQNPRGPEKFFVAPITYAGNHYPVNISWFALGH